MTRKEFIKKLIYGVFKPLLGIITLSFVITFAIQVIKENGPERFITLALLGFAAAILILSLIAEIFHIAWDSIYNKLSPKGQFFITVAGKIINIVSLLIAGVLLYVTWQKDWKLAVCYIAYLLITHGRKIIIEEKQNLHSA